LEDLSTIQNQFPKFNLEDNKVNSEEGSINRQKQIQHVAIRQDCRFIIGGGFKTTTKNTVVR